MISRNAKYKIFKKQERAFEYLKPQEPQIGIKSLKVLRRRDTHAKPAEQDRSSEGCCCCW